MSGTLDNLLFGEDCDRKQRLRIRRFLMSAGSYSMWFGIALGTAEAGLLSVGLGVVMLAGVGIVITQTVFFLILRSGLNRRFRDPALTFPQILVGLSWGLILIAVAREVRGVVLIVYMVTLLFGIFALERRQFMFGSILAFAGYLTLIIVERVIVDPAPFSDAWYLTSAVMLGGVLLWTSLFGTYFSNMRHKLATRNTELRKALEQIRTLAERDELTGLYNRRFIMDSLSQEKARADREKEPFSVCIIDLDHFKQINDRFGHGAGDRVLQNFSNLILSELRDMDLVAKGDSEEQSSTFGRYGGEEFILLLPRTDLHGARACAERLRERQEQAHRNRTDSPAVTLSAGIAEYVPGESVESLLRRADHALYDAKDHGRNQVCVPA
ncbi:MAG: GGDEF domain-containing protein [Xanthomonadales bacterium]|nr:GGDEF domain-containing protein [Xanthomonadales bacterium]